MKPDEMHRREAKLPDGRYLLYYTFEAPPPKDPKDPPPPSPPKAPRV